jgi:hypothetical protein
MFATLVRLTQNRRLVYTLAVFMCLINGIIQTVATYDTSLNLGDNSTFYAFAQNIADGEAIYKDFIHFRTPGSIMLYSLLVPLFGSQQSSIEISIRIETLIIYPLLFLAAAMILLRKHNPLLVLIALAGIALLPGYLQIRAGMGLLAIAIYILSIGVNKRKNIALGLAGLLTGITFCFGQEVALIVAITILGAELAQNSMKSSIFWQRVKYLVLGALLGILPLLLYVLLRSDLVNFLYYTLYYSFILQPRFMDVPFPELAYISTIYYLPFVLYTLCFSALFFNRKLGIPAAVILSFGVLRLITALGRSDIGHLVFSIPELFIIVPYFIVNSVKLRATKDGILRFLPFGLALIIIFKLALIKSVFLIFAPFLILIALRYRSTKERHPFNLSVALVSAIVAASTLFIFLLLPQYVSTAQAVKNGIVQAHDQQCLIRGVYAERSNCEQIRLVQAEIEKHNTKTIFSYPIQPHYYSYADEHASRFLTFEPQTTVEEQYQTIEDLKQSKPEVIVFDPLQAQSLSGSLWLINNYILNNYTISKKVVRDEILWVMVPSKARSNNYFLSYELYRKNKNTEAVGVENEDMGLTNSVQQLDRDLVFELPATKKTRTLSLSIYAENDRHDCAVVKVATGQQTMRNQKVCNNDTVLLPIPPGDSPVIISLLKDSNHAITWNNLLVKN